MARYKIYKLLLRQYSWDRRSYNFHKSEAVTCGPWRRSPPDLSIRVVKAFKYLGVITGNNPEQSQPAGIVFSKKHSGFNLVGVA
jgi:hypothetical protein